MEKSVRTKNASQDLNNSKTPKSHDIQLLYEQTINPLHDTTIISTCVMSTNAVLFVTILSRS